MNHFFALISRMKFINRWALMRNITTENISEHSHEVAVIAHALCLIGNSRCGKNYDASRAAVLALYHDSSEIITGDMPTPIKYFNPDMKNAYKAVENVANERLVTYLPTDLQAEYKSILMPKGKDAELMPLVKAADKISALIKCVEEQKMGNSEFSMAKNTIEAAIQNLNLEEAEIFVVEFMKSYSLTLDELN